MIVATDFGVGSQHDFALFKNSRTGMQKQIASLSDSAYIGIDKLHGNSQIPAKRSKLHALTQEQKAANRKLSHIRILVENVIRRLKIFRILSERYRNRRKRFSLRFNLIAAICNLELSLKK
jgi:hypothetical protein